jgi:hypothetical protein
VTGGPIKHLCDEHKVAERVAELFELKPEEVLSSGKQPQRVKARSSMCYWTVKELEVAGVDIARSLRISQSAVSRALAGGERIAAVINLKLTEDYKRKKNKNVFG